VRSAPSAIKSLRWEPVFNALYRFTFQVHFDYAIDQLFPCQIQNGGSEQGALDGGNRIWNDYDQARMKLHFAKEPDEVDAVVRDEREFILVDSSAGFQSGLPLRPR
jgi:hypothetical protein